MTSFTRSTLAAGFLACGLVAAACGGARPAEHAEAPAPTAAECVLAPGRATPAETLTVAAAGPVDPRHAPAPETDAERLLFSALYEPLVRADCGARVVAALAATWESGDGGRRWTFTLREDARFWDGVPVTARDVHASWTAREAAGFVGPWDGTVAEAVTIAGERTLIVRLARPRSDAPLPLAHPTLAVAKAVRGLRWPLGTGPYWLDESTAGLAASPAFGQARPVLLLRPLATGDARDLVDSGVDALVADDPATLAYAGTRPELRAAPVPWDRIYVVLAPPALRRVLDAARGEGTWRAVRAESRPAEGPFWWERVRACPRAPAAGPRPPIAHPTPARVAYLRGDRTAQDLAARLVALAAGDTRAVGLPPAEFPAELRRGLGGAFVLPLPRSVFDPCVAWWALVARAPWVAGLDPADAVVPVLDTRRRVVVRRAVPGLAVEWDGGVVIR